jgi:hypothetical protein
MDPLSRKLSGIYSKVEVKLEECNYNSNHLLFIDGLKLFSYNEDTMKSMILETENFFKTIGLEIDRDKSATNFKLCEDKAVVLSADEGYKYLGIVENRDSTVSKQTFEKVKKEILSRIEKICNTTLNGRNSIRAINEHAISVINYYIGIIPVTQDEYENLDNEIRQLLILHRMHFQPACKERLYLPRNEIGRGLCSVFH